MEYNDINVLRIQIGMYINALDIVNTDLAKNYYREKIEELDFGLKRYYGN